MNDMPRFAAVTTAEWADLTSELDRWAGDGRTVTLWWRDDDAVEPTQALENLLHLAGDIPLALAVIPALARPELARALAKHPRVSVLQHGWRHANHAVQGRKSEYPEDRPAAQVGAEIAAGRARLTALFGDRSSRVFVPPWNRLAPGFLPVLPACGFAAVSAMASRRPPSMPPNLAALDVHVDLVDWGGDRGFVGETAALAGLLGHLRASRSDGGAAVGVLTHHLVMDRAAAVFLERLVALTRGHRAVGWAAISDLL